jgi:hypothetical protein
VDLHAYSCEPREVGEHGIVLLHKASRTAHQLRSSKSSHEYVGLLCNLEIREIYNLFYISPNIHNSPMNNSHGPWGHDIPGRSEVTQHPSQRLCTASKQHDVAKRWCSTSHGHLDGDWLSIPVDTQLGQLGV